jgi:ribosome-binding factor A
MTIKRAEKVAEAIHEIVSQLLIREVKDPRIGFTTVTEVKLSADLHLATIYFTVVGDEMERKSSEQGLNSARGFLRKELGRNLRMRYIPDIIFKYDISADYGRRIDTLLEELKPTETGDDTENTQ